MRRKQIYLDEDDDERMKRLAERRGVPEALVIREAIAEYLVGHEPRDIRRPEDHPLWGIVGSGKAGATDTSANHDHYLYGALREDA